MEENLDRCIVTATWDNLFYLDLSHEAKADVRILIRDLQGRFENRTCHFWLLLWQMRESTPVNERITPFVEARLAEFAKCTSIRAQFLRPIPVSRGVVTESRLTFEIREPSEQRPTDSLVNRFVELAKNMKFCCMVSKWPAPNISKTYRPYIGKFSLGEVLAKERYPAYAR